MAEQSQSKQTRRARRRAAQEGAAGDELSSGSSADESSGPGAAPEEPVADTEAGESEGEVAEATATTSESIREENRRARRAAAARRRAKKGGGKAQAAEVGLDAGEMVDDALARTTDATVKWIQKHFNLVQWVIVLGVVGWISWEIYSWRQDKTEAKATDAVMAALRAERAKIGSPEDQGKPDERGAFDRRLVFRTEEEKAKATIAAYEAAAEMRPGSATAGMAKLGLAGVLYDQAKYEQARQLYESLQTSPLAAVDTDAKARAIEGVGLSLEAQDKFDAALKQYKELANIEGIGFRELGLYHQARMHLQKGEREAAKEALKKVVEKYAKDEDRPAYLFESAKDLLGQIDPSAVPKPSADEALQKALEEFKKNLPEGVDVPVIPSKAPASP